MSGDRIYDAIVVGSGMTGGWAAKELTERGLHVLMIERGRMVRHGDYPTEHKPVYDLKFRLLGDRRRGAANEGFIPDDGCAEFFADRSDHPYTLAEGTSFRWVRGCQLGGRSLTWGRQSYRMPAVSFEENARDGHGVDWPIRYADLAPWYEHVERFIGVSGQAEDNPMAPNGVYQPPMPMNSYEKEFCRNVKRAYPERTVTMARVANLTQSLGARAACHYCGPCARGCTVGAYFSTQASTLPAATATGRLEVITDTIVAKVLTDASGQRATGVEVIDAHSHARRTIRGRIVFLCASALESVRLLMLSASDRHPNGLANKSGVLGRYIMDHRYAEPAITILPANGFAYYDGYRPASLMVPRYVNLGGKTEDYLRGFQLIAFAVPMEWSRALTQPGVGATLKAELRKTGNWALMAIAMCEMLPNAANKVALDPSVRDPWGLPVLQIDVKWGDNELKMSEAATRSCVEMLKTSGYSGAFSVPADTGPPGSAIHEMGGATMGRDPRTSILDAHNRCHEISNLFVTDGAGMASSGSVNPSLTYMALTARAAAFAADQWKRRAI